MKIDRLVCLLSMVPGEARKHRRDRLAAGAAGSDDACDLRYSGKSRPVI